MFKKTSIATAIVVPASLIVLVGILIISIFSGVSAYRRESALTEEVVRTRVYEYSNLLQAQGEGAYTFATSAAPLVTQLRDTPGGRERVIESFEEIIGKNENILSIWSVWEPNAFDGRDREYANRPYHDESGRFLPAVYRHNGQVVTEYAVGFDDPELGGYYLLTKETGRIQCVGPYRYETQNGTLTLCTVAVPIIENGRFLGAVGVDLDVEEWLTTFGQVDLMGEGSIGIINPNGILAAISDETYWMKHYRDLNTGFNFGTEVERVLTSGGTAMFSGRSALLGIESYMFYQGLKIPGSDGYWAVYGIVPNSLMHSSARRMVMVNSALGAILLLSIIVSVTLLVRGQLRGLSQLSDIALKLGEGDVENVSLEVDHSPTGNEVELLKQAFDKMIAVTRDRVEVLAQIARGDLTAIVEPSSPGDVMGLALREVLANNNQILREIQICADVIGKGSYQISNGAQLLATGAEEHASSIEELSSALREVFETARDNQHLTDGTAELHQQMQQIAARGMAQMELLDQATVGIIQATADIEGIIRIIDDVSYQTNILALNASVEAARAGKYGRGLAVVADEVRNLAAKSADAARSTDRLISKTTAQTDSGAAISAETVAILRQIVANVDKNGALIEQIPSLLQSQAAALDKIYAGIEQLNASSQNTSTLAEESAATSEELHGQSQALQQVVARYRLDRRNDAPGAPQHPDRGGQRDDSANFPALQQTT